MTIAALARPEIRNLHAYQAPVLAHDTLRLNNNEAAVAIDSGDSDGLNRYPATRPEALTRMMADHYGVSAGNVLATRGSSEGIDLLVRTFCTAGQDAVLISPPAFELYEIYAAVQGATTLRVPLQTDADFALDPAAVLAACDRQTKLIFLCTPNNPVGAVISRQDILRIVAARADRSIVVVDEAYIEYSNTASIAPLVNDYDNLVVLRTLSKAHALAGARCGAVIAGIEVLRLLDGVLPPYALSSPVTSSAEQALSSELLAVSKAQVTQTIAERERLRSALAGIPAVLHTWPSQANFLLVRLRDVNATYKCLANAGIIIRMFKANSLLDGCARITIAAREDNDRLLDALRSMD